MLVEHNIAIKVTFAFEKVGESKTQGSLQDSFVFLLIWLIFSYYIHPKIRKKLISVQLSVWIDHSGIDLATSCP